MKKSQSSCFLAAVLSLVLHGEMFVWKGGSGTSWNEQANWEGGSVPNASGAEVRFDASGGLAITVAEDVTVGTVFVSGGTMTLSGSGAIALSGGTAPGFDIGDGAVLDLRIRPGGSAGLVKSGAGTLNMPLDMGGRYTGTTVVRAGTFVLQTRTAGSGEAWIGSSLLVEKDGVFRQMGNDMLPATYAVTVDGGKFVGNNVGDYIGHLTLRNGGEISGFSFLIDDQSRTQKVTVNSGTGTISCPLAIGSQWGAFGGIKSRTLQFDVAEGCTLYVSGAIRSHWSGDTATYPDYVGGVQKIGGGKLTLSGVSAYFGDTSIEDGTVELSGNASIAGSVFRMNGGSLTVADGATPRIGGLYDGAGHVVAVPGRTFEIGGASGDSFVAGGLSAGRLVKTGGKSLTILGHGQAIGSLDVNAGTVAIGGYEPLVRYTFDDAANLGRDSGRLGKTLTVQEAATAVAGVHGGAVRIASRSTVGLTASAEGLPSGKSPFTICSWVKPEAGWMGFFTWGQANTQHRYLFTHFDNWTMKLGIYGSAECVASRSMGANTWHHVALVCDTAADVWEERLYFDGELVAYKAFEAWQRDGMDIRSDGTTTFAIGNPSWWDGFCGTVDDLQIFDVALPQDHIRNIMGNVGDSGVLASGSTVRVDASGTLASAGGTNVLTSVSGRGTLHVGAGSRVEVSVPTGETCSVGTVGGDGEVVKSGSGDFELTRATAMGTAVDVREGTLRLRGGCAGLAGHVVAHYTFDDASNRGADSSGNGFSLASVGKSFTVRSERLPGTMYFDGSAGQSLTFDTAVESAAYARLPSGNASYTVACWINPDGAIAWNGGIFSWGEASPLKCVAMRFHAATGFDGFRIFNWGFDKDYPLASRSVFTSPAAPDGWHHVVVTYENAGANKGRRFYLDGVLQGTGESYSGTLQVSASRFNIGRCLDGASTWAVYKGYLDDFIVLDCAVSGAQAQALMQGLKRTDGQNGGCRLADGASVEAVAGEVDLATISASGAIRVSAGNVALPEDVSIGVSDGDIDIASVTLRAGDRLTAGSSVVSGSLTLPARATVVYSGTSVVSRTILASADTRGSVTGWTVSAPNLKSGLSVAVRKVGDEVVFAAFPSGTVIVVR